MIRPTLSIVVPVSKMSGKLEALKEWVLSTEHLPLEVILVHDFQDQATQTELEELQAESLKRRIQVSLFKVSNKNPGETRNFGITKSSGKWIQFVDSDDSLDARRSLEAISKVNEEIEIVITNFRVFDAATRNLKHYPHKSNLTEIALNPGIWRMLFKNSAIGENRFRSYRMGEDQLFLTDLRFFAREIQFSDDTTYTYYKGIPDQLTSQSAALKDLCEVTSLTAHALNSSSPNEKKYIAIMLIKQSISYSRTVKLPKPLNQLQTGLRVLYKTNLMNWKYLFRAIPSVVMSKKI